MNMIFALLAAALSTAAIAEPVLPDPAPHRDPNAIAQALLFSRADAMTLIEVGSGRRLPLGEMLAEVRNEPHTTRCYLVIEEAMYACTHSITEIDNGVTHVHRVSFEVDMGADGMPEGISNLRAYYRINE